MVPRFIFFFTVALGLPLLEAADFHKIYDSVHSRSITILTWHGDIKLSSYDGNSVEVLAVRKGPDRDLVKIQEGGGHGIHLFSRYLDSKRNNATVDYEIHVPKGIFFDNIHLKSNSGTITVEGAAGFIRLETVGRAIEARDVEGTLIATSVSGDVKGYLKQTTNLNMLRFSSSSGNVVVQAPVNLNAQVHLESASGQLKTDFPLEVKEMRYGPGKFAHGKLGTGNQVLEARSIFGAVNLFKKPLESVEKDGK